MKRSTQNGRYGKVHLVVPRLVDGCEMLGKLLDKRHQDQAHKGIRDMVILDDILNLENQNDGDDGDEGNADDKGNNTFGHGILGLGLVLVLITVSLLIMLKDGVVDAMMCPYLEEHVDKVGDQEKDGDDARDLQSFVFQFLGCERCSIGVETILKHSRDGQSNTTVEIVSLESCIV